MNLPHTKRMAPDFFAKIRDVAAKSNDVDELVKLTRACLKIERQYKAIEASALEVRRLWRPWAEADGK